MGNTEGCSSLSRMVFDGPVIKSRPRHLSSQPLKGNPMSDSSSAGTENTGTPKKKVSPARNVIGIVILLVVVVIGWFQYLRCHRVLRGSEGAERANGKIEDKELMDMPGSRQLARQVARRPRQRCQG